MTCFKMRDLKLKTLYDTHDKMYQLYVNCENVVTKTILKEQLLKNEKETVTYEQTILKI